MRLPRHPADWIVLLVAGVAGMLALLALIAPDAVAFSSFLVLPFLILYPAPTVALYVMPFAGLYAVVAPFNRAAAALVGLIAVGGLGFALPTAINGDTAGRNHLAVAHDRAPTHPLRATGVVGIVERRQAGERDCSDLCMALLYSGSVVGVVEATSLRPQDDPRSPLLWRIEQRHRPCPLQPRDVAKTGMRWSEINVASALTGRALLGECVVGRPARLTDADFAVQWEAPGPSSERISLWRIGRGGRPTLLARRTWGLSRPLTVPLSLDLGGSPVGGAYWTWARTGRSEGPPPTLERFVAFDARQVRPADPHALRAVLDGWLDHAGVWDEAQQGALFTATLPLMQGAALEPGDLARYQRLIADPRTDPFYVGAALRAFPDRTAAFREPVLARTAALAPDTQELFRLNDVIGDFPAGSFAEPSPTMLLLIDDVQKRRRLPTLVVRLSDEGPASAPALFALLHASLRGGTPGSGSMEQEGNVAVAQAALAGLCRLGPTIATSYVRVEGEVRRDPILHEYLRGTAWWAAVRVRLGRPTGSIVVPAKAGQGWWDQYRQIVRKGRCDLR